MNITFYEHTKTPSESIKRIKKALNQEEEIILHYGEAVDKLTQYQFFKDNNIPHPEWTINKGEAAQWLQQGNLVVCREFLKSGKGHGVSIVDTTPLPDAKVYCKYQKKKREFRVNLFRGKVVNVREKKRKLTSTGNSNIWSPGNGYITTHVKVPIQNLPLVMELAEKAAKITKSDFIGVDIIYNEFYNKYYVLEVNSGPSIEGSSVNEFIAVIKEWYNENHA